MSDAERLANLRARRADVYSPKRERFPYYGDDDIDLLFRQLASAEKVIEVARELLQHRLPRTGKVIQLKEALAEYDRPSAPSDSP